MVIFNDPLPCDDPGKAALELALAMRNKMASLCSEWRKLGHRLGFGVGISLGYATVGIVGKLIQPALNDQIKPGDAEAGDEAEQDPSLRVCHQRMQQRGR